MKPQFQLKLGLFFEHTSDVDVLVTMKFIITAIISFGTCVSFSQITISEMESSRLPCDSLVREVKLWLKGIDVSVASSVLDFSDSDTLVPVWYLHNNGYFVSVRPADGSVFCEFALSDLDPLVGMIETPFLSHEVYNSLSNEWVVSFSSNPVGMLDDSYTIYMKIKKP
jgi:hypothetical protein